MELFQIFTVIYVTELKNQWLICSSYNFYDTYVVVNLAACGINSAGYILCCQLPFDIIIDFSCQSFGERENKCTSVLCELLDQTQVGEESVQGGPESQPGPWGQQGCSRVLCQWWQMCFKVVRMDKMLVALGPAVSLVGL